MTQEIAVTITCRVFDAEALWAKARDHLVDCGNLEPGADGDSVIGTRDDPDLGACLIMLLDRSENLDGASIEDSTAEEVVTFDLFEAEDDD